MPSDPDQDRQRLGELLIRRRLDLDARYRNRQVFADERGVEYRIVSDIERGRRSNFQPVTIAAIEAAYRLAPGAIAWFMASGELEVQGAPRLAAAAGDGVPMSAARRAENEPHKEAIRDLIAQAIVATRNPVPRGKDIFADEHEQKAWDRLAELFRDLPEDEGKLERIAGYMAEGRQQAEDRRAAQQGRAAGLIAVRG